MTTTSNETKQSSQTIREFVHESVRAKLNQEQLDLLFQGIKTHALQAFAYPDEEEPDALKFAAFDSSGRRLEGSAKYRDSQAEYGAEIDTISLQAPTSAGVDDRNVSELARDESLKIEDRISALQEWMLADADEAANFVLQELSTSSIANDWLRELVFALEDLPLHDQKHRDRTCELLCRIATEFRQSSEAGVERVVWSALRRFASLVPVDQAHLLADFLSPGGNIDTRLVALQGVTRIFSVSPPAQLGGPLSSLADYAFDYANRCLDPFVFTAGDISAIAIEAINAIAALGDNRLGECIGKADELSLSWLSRTIRGNLQDLLESWNARNEGFTSSAAYRQIEAVFVQSN